MSDGVVSTDAIGDGMRKANVSVETMNLAVSFGLAMLFVVALGAGIVWLTVRLLDQP